MNKRDLFHMNQQQVAAGRKMWQRTGQQGRLANSSFDAEAMAPKTWILYANSKGEEIKTIECEIYAVGRLSNASEAVSMLVGMCPKDGCGESFLAREDNKTMSIDYVPYRQAPAFLRVNWKWHCENTLGRRPSDDDKIPVVTSPERWACDYCKSWCVKVYAGVAKDDHRGVTQFTVHGNVPVFERPESGGSMKF
jgi:hypothetical protein